MAEIHTDKGFYVRETTRLLWPIMLAATALLVALLVVEVPSWLEVVIGMIIGIGYGVVLLASVLSYGAYRNAQKMLRERREFDAWFSEVQEIAKGATIATVRRGDVTWRMCSGREEK